MAWDEWLDIPLIKTISQHTSSSIAALFSFVLIAEIAKWGLSDIHPLVYGIIEWVERAGIILIFLRIAFVLVRDLWKGGVSNGKPMVLLVA